MNDRADTDAERRHRITDLANAAALLRSAAENVGCADAEVRTPYGPAHVRRDGNGADVELPSGATVHVRFGEENFPD